MRSLVYIIPPKMCLGGFLFFIKYFAFFFSVGQDLAHLTANFAAKQEKEEKMYDVKSYLQSQSTDYNANRKFEEWLKESADADAKRDIINNVERRVKSIVGEGFRFPHLGEQEWKRLEWLISVRRSVLDALMMPTEEEVRMMGEQNERLLEQTHRLYDKTFEMWKVMNDAGLNSNDYCVRATFDFGRSEENVVRRLDNDNWYGSDFSRMIGILADFGRRENRTISHIHETLQCFGQSEEKARGELVGVLDDGDTWADGALCNQAFKNIAVCYMLHAVCSHFHYSLADVLRMDSFTIRVYAEYEHSERQTL